MNEEMIEREVDGNKYILTWVLNNGFQANGVIDTMDFETATKKDIAQVMRYTPFLDRDAERIKEALEEMYNQAAEEYRKTIIEINTISSLPQDIQSTSEINISISCRNTTLKVTAKIWKERMKWVDYRLKELEE